MKRERTQRKGVKKMDDKADDVKDILHSAIKKLSARFNDEVAFVNVKDVVAMAGAIGELARLYLTVADTYSLNCISEEQVERYQSGEA